MPITYNAGTNTITIVGGFNSGTSHATDVSTTHIRNDSAFTGNTPTTWQNRYLWFYNNYSNATTLEYVVRRVLGTKYNGIPITPDYPWLQSYPSTAYVASYTWKDVYDASVAGSWGVVSLLGSSMFKISAYVILGDGTTPTFLTMQFGMVDFGDTTNDKYGFLIKAKAFYQQGEMYAGLPQGGGSFRLYANSSSTSKIDSGVWVAYNTNLQLCNQFNQAGTPSIFYINRCKVDNFMANINGLFYITDGETYIKDSGSAQTTADSFRNFTWTFRNNPTLDNATFSHNSIISFQRVALTYYLYVRNLVIGNGDVTVNVNKYDSLQPHNVIFVNPTNLNIANVVITNDNMTLPVYIQISQAYDCQLIDTSGANISGGLVDLTDKDLTTGGSFLTAANGSITQQSISVSWRRLWIDIDTTTLLAPYKIRYFKYGKVPLELSQDFNKSVAEKIILSTDSNITLSYSAAMAVSGVVINSGVFADRGRNIYSYQVDCGGNTLSDAFHNLAARMATHDTNDTSALMARTRSIEVIKTADGNSFFGTTGYLIVNYSGTLSFTVANDGTKYTPLAYSTYTVTNLIPGSEVRVYDTETGLEVGGTEATLSNLYAHQYDYVGTNMDVTFVVFHKNYQPLTFNATLDGALTSTPVFQIFDRVYYNPPTPEIPINYIDTSRNNPIIFTLNQLVDGTTYKDEAFNFSELIGINIVTQPPNGTVVNNGNGTFTYTPDTGYLGIDEFEFMPVYNTTYEGVVQKARARFDVALFRGNAFQNWILLGDSITFQVFSGVASLEGGTLYYRFNMKHEQLYGKQLNVYNEGVGGWHMYHIKDSINSILSKYTNLDPDKTLVTISAGTNNLQGLRMSSEALKQASRNTIASDLAVIKTAVESYGFTFEILEIPFLTFDTGNSADTVWSNADNTLYHEDYGAKDWNDGTNGINDTAASLTSEFTNLSTGNTIEQLYNYTYQYRDTGNSDIVHPNTWGCYLYQQCLLDTVFLYNAFGKKPIPIDKTLNHQAVINFTNDTAVAGTVLDLNNRYPNNLDYTAGITNAPIYMNDTTLSPWTISVSNNGTLVASGNDMAAPEEYLPNDYLQYGIEIQSGNTLTITIDGLTANNIYKFQAIGSFAGAARTGRLSDPVRNLNSVCKAGLFTKDNVNFIANTRSYYDLTLIPSSSSITLSLTTFDSSQVAAYINAIQMWLLAV